MALNLKDLEGKKFGAWTVISPAPPHKTRAALNCKCDCGAERVVIWTNLRTGRSTSCGCGIYVKNVEGDSGPELASLRKTRPVYCIEEGIVFPSAKDASLYVTGEAHASKRILNAARRGGSTLGYHWKF